MTLLEYLRRQFAYDDWANREVLNAIRSGSADHRSLQLLAHILAAERLWLERLQSQPQTVPVWPQPALTSCEREVDALPPLWRNYLSETGEPGLSKPISYRNTKGEPFDSTVIDILTHVVMHAAYHRGQIATHMRAHNQTPAYTDFIHGIRQGFVK